MSQSDNKHVAFITAVSVSQLELYRRYFLPSLTETTLAVDRNTSHQNLVFNADRPGNGDFYSPEFFSSLEVKWRNIVRNLRANLSLEPILVFCDVDIWFYKNPAPYLRENVWRVTPLMVMAENESDNIVDANAGFIACLPCNDTLNLAHAVYEAALLPEATFNDQNALRVELESFVGYAKNSAKLLPRTFANTKTVQSSPLAERICYHAICTRPRDGKTSVELKMELLEKHRHE